MAERKVRYEVEIESDKAAEQARRLAATLERDQQRAVQQALRTEQQAARLVAEKARAEMAAATARARAGQEYLRSERELQRAVASETQARQAQVRLASEAARAEAAATKERQRQLNAALQAQTQMQRLATETARTELMAAREKTRASQDALRLERERANVATAQARSARAQSVPAGDSGGLGLAGLGGALTGGLAALGIGLGVREIVQATGAIAELNTMVLRSRQAFTVLSGSQEESERRLKGIKTAAGDAIADLDAMALANRLVALNMAGSTAEMAKAIETGRRISAVMGGDVVSALENLSLAAANQSFVRLDTMGISAQAVRDRMKELREETKNLSAEQAFLQAAMDVANKTFAEVNLDAAISGTERMEAAVKNLKTALAGGWIGEGTNQLLNMAAIGVNAVSGQGATASRQFFDATLKDVRTLHSQDNSALLARAGRYFGAGQFNAEYLAAGETLNTAFEKIDQAVMAGIPGLDAYEAQLRDLANAWAVEGDNLQKNAADIETVSKVLDQLNGDTSAYNLTLKALETNQTASKVATEQMLDRAVALDVALATGKLTIEDYTALVRDMQSALAGATGAAGALQEAMQLASAAHNRYVVSAGALGAAAGPLTAEEMTKVNRYRYSGAAAKGMALDPWGAPVPAEVNLGAWGWGDGKPAWIDLAVNGQAEIRRAQESAAKEWERAAEVTQREMEAAAKKLQADFESALGKVPGLLGVSSVTSEDMRMAESGVYTEKADEWLRQLADEVLNGVDRPNVDIGDAKARAGLDPGMDNKAALAIVQSMWADSSLFAGGANTDLINRAAVERDLARQRASKSGQSAILGMFGIPAGDETPLAASIAAAQSGGMIPDAESIKQELLSMTANVQSMASTEEVTSGMKSAGKTLASAMHAGFVDEVNRADWAGPVVNAVAAGATAIALQGLNQALQD